MKKKEEKVIVEHAPWHSQENEKKCCHSRGIYVCLSWEGQQKSKQKWRALFVPRLGQTQTRSKSESSFWRIQKNILNKKYDWKMSRLNPRFCSFEVAMAMKAHGQLLLSLVSTTHTHCLSYIFLERQNWSTQQYFVCNSQTQFCSLFSFTSIKLPSSANKSGYVTPPCSLRKSNPSVTFSYHISVVHQLYDFAKYFFLLDHRVHIYMN